MISGFFELLITAFCSRSTEEGQAAENVFFAGRKWKSMEESIAEEMEEYWEKMEEKLLHSGRAVHRGMGGFFAAKNASRFFAVVDVDSSSFLRHW